MEKLEYCSEIFEYEFEIDYEYGPPRWDTDERMYCDTYNVGWEYEVDGYIIAEDLTDYDPLYKDYPELENIDANSGDFDTFMAEHFDEIVKKYHSYLDDLYQDQAYENCLKNWDGPEDEDYDDYDD